MAAATGDPDDSRVQQQQRQSLLEDLAADYATRPGVSRGLMFGNAGLTYEGSFFALVGREGRLIVKVPADRVRELVESGARTPVQPGTRVLREWVGVPLVAAGPADERRALLDEAFEYAVLLKSPSSR